MIDEPQPDVSDPPPVTTCFIISPIGQKLAPIGTPGRVKYENAIQIWEKVLEPACTEVHLTPVRGDKISESGDINDQIFTWLRDADVVIADVTGGNANVMYELGLRHTRDKLTIQLGEYEHLPFDINTIRTIQFVRTEAGLIDARSNLVEALRVGLEGHSTPVAATRIWSEGAALDPAAIAEGSALSQEDDDPDEPPEDEAGPGRMDRLAEGEAALERLNELSGVITSAIVATSEAISDATPRMQAANSFAGRIVVSRELVARLADPTSNLDVVSNEYTQRIAQIDAMVRIITDQVAADPDGTEPETWSYFASVVGLSNSAEEASAGIAGMLPGLREMRGNSQVFRDVSRSQERSINRILRGNTVIVSWRDLVLALPDAEAHLAAATEADNADVESVEDGER